MQRIRRGFERIATASTDHAGEAVEQAKLTQQLHCQVLGFVGDHGNLDAAFVQRVEHRRPAGIQCGVNRDIGLVMGQQHLPQRVEINAVLAAGQGQRAAQHQP